MNSPTVQKIKNKNEFCCRILSIASNLLPGVDMSGRTVLHSKYYALVHNKRGSLPKSPLPDEIRAQQNT